MSNDQAPAKNPMLDRNSEIDLPNMDIGPQRGPASVGQINAQVKQAVQQISEAEDGKKGGDLLNWLRRHWRQDGTRMKTLNRYWDRREKRWVIW